MLNDKKASPREQNYPGAGTNPAPSLSRAFSYLSHTIPDFTDNCLINIMRCGDDFYATTETNYIRKINPQTLETLDKVSQAYSQRPCLTRERNPHSPPPGGGQAAYEELTGRSPPLMPWCLLFYLRRNSRVSIFVAVLVPRDCCIQPSHV